MGAMTEMLTLTPAAARRVAWIAERQARPAVLRLAVDGGGCSGFQYRFELVEGPDSDWIHLPDPVADSFKQLSERLAAAEERLARLDGANPEGEVRELRPRRGPSPAGG